MDGPQAFEGRADAPVQTMDAPAGRPPVFWLEHVRLGLGMSATVIVVLAGYLLVTPDRGNRSLMWALLGVAAVVTVVIALLPWARLLRTPVGLRLMIGWSLALVPLIVALATLDGGPRSPLILVLLLPLIFAAMAYPPRVTLGVGSAMVVGQLWVVATAPDPHPAELFVQGALLALIALMGTMIARNHERSLANSRELADRLAELADVDGLTGCLNHRSFRERLDAEVARTTRARGRVALLHVDLDHFKAVNDSFGHPVGDEVLANVGAVLAGMARRSDVVARIGGEEFAMLLPDTVLDDAVAVAERVRDRIGALQRPVHVTASVGVSALPEVADTEAQLVSTADRALYAAKRSGRDRVVAAPNVRARLAERAMTVDGETVLRLLSEPQRLLPRFQPIVAIVDGGVHGHEGLVRVQGSDVPPDRWLRAAEQLGLRAELEATMWDVVLAANRRLASPVRLFLNASPDALLAGSLWARIADLPPGTVVEVSEQLMMSRSTVIADAVRRWRDAGIRLAIDDLGAGSASLRTVLELEPEFIKLDRSLVSGLHERERHRALVGALASFASQTDATIVAVAKRNGGGSERFLGTVTPIDLAGGRIQVAWPPGTFADELGTITYQVRVGRDSELQTVYEGAITVGKSIREPD